MPSPSPRRLARGLKVAGLYRTWEISGLMIVWSLMRAESTKHGGTSATISGRGSQVGFRVEVDHASVAVIPAEAGPAGLRSASIPPPVRYACGFPPARE